MGLNILTRVAMCGYRGIAFSLEMPKMEVASRILAAGARVPYRELVERKLTAETLEATTRFMAEFPQFQTHMKIDDQVEHTIESISTAARSAKRSGLDYIFIDYIQLLNSKNRTESRYQELGAMSKAAKQLAMRLDIAVVIAAQLNRNPEQQNRIPTMSDLRESGNLEADADVVLMLSRGGDLEMPDIPLVDVSIVKNRTGQRNGIVSLPEHFEQARIGA